MKTLRRIGLLLVPLLILIALDGCKPRRSDVGTLESDKAGELAALKAALGNEYESKIFNVAPGLAQTLPPSVSSPSQGTSILCTIRKTSGRDYRGHSQWW